MALGVVYVLWARRTSPNRLTDVPSLFTYAYVNPVIAVLLGVLVVDERFSALQLAGGGIVLLASCS